MMISDIAAVDWEVADFDHQAVQLEAGRRAGSWDAFAAVGLASYRPRCLVVNDVGFTAFVNPF